ncbi:MAG: FmdB family zinc ribbon protein [Desulfobulbus sp.]|jgi:putative FmdB family regulatory protein
MPIYEYECDQCKVFEVSQSITEAPLNSCPTCGQPVRKLISASSFLLKGGGWYADGYSRETSAGNTSSSTDSTAPAASTPPCQGGTGSCAHCPASS